MVNKRSLSIGLLFVGILFIEFCLLLNYKISVVLVSDLITFLAIIFGFYVTSLAIFSSSTYVTGLYRIVDTRDSSMTLLHRLIRNYRWGLRVILVSISYLLVVDFLLSQCDMGTVVLKTWWISPLPLIIGVNLVYGYFMLDDLLKIVVQEAKGSD